jgi:hypothetical protein
MPFRKLQRRKIEPAGRRHHDRLSELPRRDAGQDAVVLVSPT